MVMTSLAASRLASNDVCSLAEVYKTAFHYYCTHSSPFAKDFLQDVKTLVGLGFAITLVDGDLLPLYKIRLDTFLKLHRFKEHPGDISYLSLSIAEMIDVASYLFELKGYPGYYNEFASAIQKTVDNIVVHTSDMAAEAKRLLPLLVQEKGMLTREFI